MSSQLPRQTDGELAEYDGSLTGDQVFYTNIYFDILWKWIPRIKAVISAFICCFFTDDIFKGASNAESSCEDWVSQPRRSWGEFFQLEPTVGRIAHPKSNKQCEWCRSWLYQHHELYCRGDYFQTKVMTPMNPFFASKFFPASLTLAEEEGLAWCR